MEKQIVVYKAADDISLEVQTDGETVWLTQEQMCRLFGRERSVITKHIANIFKEGELEREVVCAKFAHTTLHGAMKGKLQKKDVVAYNLDVVISVGYRVKSSLACFSRAQGRSRRRSGSGGHFLNRRS